MEGKVRDGYSETADVLQRYCSTTLPRPLTTSGPFAWLRLHTDQSSADQGFHITYSQIPGIPGCGGELAGEQGTLSTPTHMQRYHHNMDCEWRIRVPGNERVQLVFDSFELEGSFNCIFDFVEVRDGPDPDSPLVGRYCGRNTLPPPFAASGNELYVRFYSDYSVSHGGFSATYDVVCGGVFFSESGVLRSPNFPENYPHGKRCEYLIRQEPGRAIVLQFHDFLMENSFACFFDYLEVFDGRDSSFPSLGKFCNEPPPTLISRHNYMYILFVTDGSVHNRGFLANFTSIDTECGGILVDQQGTINSPTHPEQYPNGITCSWVIHRPPGEIVRLTWLSFSLEAATRTGSCYDSVSVYDNSTAAAGTNGGLIGRPYCGQRLPPIMTTLGNVMTVIFTSDTSITHDGFAASFIGLNASTLCGGTYHTISGVLTSPNFPGPYPPSKECTWIIEAPQNQQIMLNVSHFGMEDHFECNYDYLEIRLVSGCDYLEIRLVSGCDYLEIRNGGSATAPLIGKYCGTNMPRQISSHAHRLFLHFRSDGSLSGAGFRISWDATATGCGGRLTGPRGSIISPNYPQPYAHMAVCTWVIAGNAGNKVRISFLDMDIEGSDTCNMDYVAVYEGAGPSAVLKKRACGSDQLDVVESKTNIMTVKFVTDFSTATTS
ncbi:CUB domain-containing protein 2-like [Pollicipes pollicipes]|uniref:CUB domain-containing protein 2-like n=1 Tax=Pollicipes pollicipes TaxID=41117 RepID=UPI001884C7D6|nr:CUB domain-containing protein 2-like [Pollicipes pollicipes]